MNYRKISIEEVLTLENQGCYCDDWEKVEVKEGFRADNIHHVRFEGKIRLGILDGLVTTASGTARKAGLYSSHFKDCDIEDSVYISRTGLLQGYDVEKNVVIENTASMMTSGMTQFGNGIEIEVMNEGGGRELPVYDRLTAQIAYLLVTYRHDEQFILQLKELIRQYCNTKRSVRGRVSEGCCIRNASEIVNVYFGEGASVAGATLLREGSVVSTLDDPSEIGNGVSAEEFIILSGSQVGSGVILDKCFIGQGVRIGKQFSAENSAFFANSEAYHGEGVSLFAGPYTATHHKSTLLIAAMMSFYNAGSGTNQSNHMYKLGPLHQGLLERGCKTGSFSYMLWPCRVGAYSVIMDKHATNFDTSEFPFSYITIENGKSMLTPAMNLFTVGTRRDSAKWPKRDRRLGEDKRDLVHFDLFSPYVIERVLRGSNALEALSEKASKTQKVVNYKGVGIPRLLLKTGRKYYQIALKKYYGETLVRKLAQEDVGSLKDLRKVMSAHQPSEGKWLDIAGMFVPQDELEKLQGEVRAGKLKSIEDISNRLTGLFEAYEQLSWSWYLGILKSELGIEPDQVTPEQLEELITNWKTNAIKLNNMILKDAEKEFDPGSRIGFGVDGDEETRDLDFIAVRGDLSTNGFIRELKEENEWIEGEAEKWLEVLGVVKA